MRSPPAHATPTPYQNLAVPNVDSLVFGTAPRPVSCGFGLTIGAGLVYPELNFTLPAITICEASWREICAQYEDMAVAILRRAVALKVPGIVLEFELLPAMTQTPEWGAEITALLKGCMGEAYGQHGLKSALRVTPTDVRDQGKPPELRYGAPWEQLLQTFDLCIDAGADLVSIESVGGKEVYDPALMYGDFRGIVLALGVLAPRDVAWLWTRICDLCHDSGTTIPAGDTACGFANTAMQLAHQKMLPEVLAAVVRAMSAVRSLVAFEHGAVGPLKGCAYEGSIIKAITGCPISMEGKSAACAHFSPVGHIAAAMCDLWSNESVQNVRLLSGGAPEAFTEVLAYDCRLMNVATESGRARVLRDWLVASDEWLSPQAALLSPEATLAIASAIVSAEGTYRRTRAAGRTAVSLLTSGVEHGRLKLNPSERQWLDRIEHDLATLPLREDEFLEQVQEPYVGQFDPEAYGL